MVPVSLLRIFPSFLTLGLCLWIIRQPLPLFGLNDGLVSGLPIIIALVGAGFSWFFRRGNVAIGFGLFCLWYSLLQQESDAPLIFTGLTYILPLNAILLSLWIERGILTSAGLMKCLFLCTQVLLIFLLAYGDSGRFHDASLDALLWTPLTLPDTLTVPFLALCFYGLAALWFLIRIFLYGLPLDAGWLVFLIASLFAVLYLPYIGLTASLATLGLVLAVVQDSYRMAFLDELTGIPARRALLSDMKKLGTRYVVAMADIDHFKKFNDTHGHDVGDQVLRMVAVQLSRVTGGGRAYRYGGEEFTILFPNKSVEEALPHLEKTRERIEAASFTLRGPDRPKKKGKDSTKNNGGAVVRVTSSFGAAEKDRGSSDPMAVMKKADEALYRAKKAGRNCVAS